MRDRWLNPPEWVEWVDEPVPGYPKRPVRRGEVAVDGTEETHANEPLQRPPAVAPDAHDALDAAEAAAYGWLACLSDEDAAEDAAKAYRAGAPAAISWPGSATSRLRLHGVPRRRHRAGHLRSDGDDCGDATSDR